MAEEVMPRVNAAIGTPTTAAAEKQRVRAAL